MTGKGSLENGALVIGAVFHVLSEDNTGEFDPYFIERIKNALQLMRNKNFVEALEQDLRESTLKDRPSMPSQYRQLNTENLQSTVQQRASIVPNEKTNPQIIELLKKPLQAVNLGLQPLDPLSNTVLRTQVYDYPQRASDASGAVGHHIKSKMQQIDEEFKLATISL